MESGNRFYTKPSIYITEVSHFYPVIEPLATSLPAFIGFTAGGSEFRFQPKKIRSMMEYLTVFGDDDQPQIEIEVIIGRAPKIVGVNVPRARFTMFHQLKMFFENGGKECVVISAGNTSPADDAADSRHMQDLLSALGALHINHEATMLVFPDAVLLSRADYSLLMKSALQHCASSLNRFAIIDLYEGSTYNDSAIAQHRAEVGDEHLRFGASYFPFLQTFLTPSFHPEKILLKISNGSVQSSAYLSGSLSDEPGAPAIRDEYPQLYTAVQNMLAQKFIVLAPSGAIAGIICRTDTDRGIWKSPANMEVRGAMGLPVLVTQEQQSLLNVDYVTGKSINVIREFAGRGILVWGARTLDGNSPDWRYVAVQRLMKWVEACVKTGLEKYTFTQNDTTTWVRIRAMIENFLTLLWKQGAFMGMKTEEAFFVRIGIGQTMTAADIAEGRLIAEVGVAPLKPAEFVILRFSHFMQNP